MVALVAACVRPAAAQVAGTQPAPATERTRIELQISPARTRAAKAATKSIPKADTIRVQEVLRKRIVAYGLPAPRVQFQRPDHILIELALGQSGAPSVADLKALLTERGLLEFRAIPRAYADREERMPEMTEGPEGPTYTFRDASSNVVPVEKVLAKSKVLASSRDLLPNSRVISASRARFGMPSTELQVYFELGDAARQVFRLFTGSHIGSYVAITLDGAILACPIIKSAVPGEGVIEAAFDQPGGAARAQRLAAMINSGPLPLTVRWVSAKPVPAAVPTPGK